MIPYPYNMVDMGGIDLAEANGTFVEGLYSKIVEAVNACGDVVLYNWKFAGIEISPQHTSILLGDPITINGAVQVTEQDLVTVPGINPEPPPPPPPLVLIPLDVTDNGQYLPEDYDADGFSEVLVSVTQETVDGVYSPEFYQSYASLDSGNIFVKDRHAYMVLRLSITSMQAVKIGEVPDTVKPANVVYFRVGNGGTTLVAYGKILPDGGIYITNSASIGNYGFLYAEWEVPQYDAEFVINSNIINYIDGDICVIGDTCFACSKISINSTTAGWKDNIFSIPESLAPQSSVTGIFYADPYDVNSMSPSTKDVTYDSESRSFSIWLPTGTQIGTFRAVWRVQSTTI